MTAAGNGGSQLRRLGKYELFVLDSLVKSNGEYPIWALSEKKAFYWMFDMLNRMLSNWNGYNITKLVRFQMDNAPKSRYIRLPEMSLDMITMLKSFCEVLEDLQKNVLSHYPARITVNLMGKEDRDRWDDECEKIREILKREPDPARIEEDAGVAEARKLVEADGFTNVRYYGREDNVIVFRTGKLKEDNFVYVRDGQVLIPPT